MLHRELANLACAIEPALNVTRPPAGKIAHRQREKLPAEKIKNSGIEPHRGEGEQIFLCDRCQLHKNNRGEHAEDDGLEKAEIILDDHLVHHHLGENREEQLEETDRNRKSQHLQQNLAELCQERPDPGHARFALRRLLESNRVIKQRRVPGPLLLEFFAWNFAQAQRGIRHAHLRFVDVVEHHPVIAFPVHNRGQGHHRQIAKRNLQRSRRQTELDRGATKRLQTRAVSGGVTKLSDARETNLAPEVAANHAQTRGAAVHFIDLRDVLEFADAALLFPEMSLVVGKRRLCALLFFDRELPIERDFVVRQRFRRNQFLGEIEGNTRFGFHFVLRQPFFQQLAEFGIALLQTAHGIRIERENITIRICFDRSRTWRAVQNRELTKKIPIPIECEIHLSAIVLRKSAGPSFLQDVHRSRGIALLNYEIALLKLNSLEFLDHASKRESRQSPEIAEFVEETLQRACAPRHLHVFLQLRSGFGQRQELSPISRNTSTEVLQRTVAVRVPPSVSAASPKLSPGRSVPRTISSPLLEPDFTTRARPEIKI